MRLLRKRETAGRVGLHPVSIMRKARNPEDDFPTAITISRNVVCFSEDEIDDWIKRRLAERDLRRASQGDLGAQRHDARGGSEANETPDTTG